jgi:hypothetical protein
MRAKVPLPKAIANAPEIHFGLELYWDAYAELSTARPATFSGIAPIPWGVIADYAMVYDFDEEQTRLLHYFVRELDAEFLKWNERKADANGNVQKLQRVREKNGRRS